MSDFKTGRKNICLHFSVLSLTAAQYKVEQAQNVTPETLLLPVFKREEVKRPEAC
jgi:hypothetical protein